MPRGRRAGVETYWTSFGQGPRAALMIHCSLGSSSGWGKLAKHLSGALTMTAFDLPGHGRSDDWDAQGDFQTRCLDIAASFPDDAWDVIGHSFGATVALRLAVERPDLVRSLILIEPVFFAVAHQDRPEVGAALDARMMDFTSAIVAGDFETAVREFTSIWGDGTPWAAIPQEQRHLLTRQIPLIEAGGDALSKDTAGLLVGDALARISAPVLLIEGSQSPAIIRTIHDGLAARIPDSKRSVIMGAGHMVPITHADQVSAEVLRFLSG